eukprot:7064992-Alexandrium_andersonii.AAC.1
MATSKVAMRSWIWLLMITWTKIRRRFEFTSNRGGRGLGRGAGTRWNQRTTIKLVFWTAQETAGGCSKQLLETAGGAVSD